MSILKHIAALARILRSRGLASPTGALHDHGARLTEACRHPGAKDAHYQCRCHERMGNDFWFLPTGRCLWDEK